MTYRGIDAGNPQQDTRLAIAKLRGSVGLFASRARVGAEISTADIAIATSIVLEALELVAARLAALEREAAVENRR